MIRAVIVGASGRMGRALLRCALQWPAGKVIAAVDHAGSEFIGRDAGELAGIGANGMLVRHDLAALLAAGADVVIDFSDASATAGHLDICAAASMPILVGTTGLHASVEAHAAAAAQRTAVLLSPNTSLGVTLLSELVRRVARSLPAEFDIEIVETHHRQKKDAPSGTALALGAAAAEGRGQQLGQVARQGRSGLSPRIEGEIGFSVMRGGDVVGEHAVRFLGPGERLELTHVATDREIFARGALKVAEWLAAQPPGRYLMKDTISL